MGSLLLAHFLDTARTIFLFVFRLIFLLVFLVVSPVVFLVIFQTLYAVCLVRVLASLGCVRARFPFFALLLF